MADTLERRIAAALTAPPDFDAILRMVLAHFGAETGTIHRLDPADAHLHLVAASSGIPEAVLAVTRRIPLGKGIAGEAAESRKPVTMCNLQTDRSGVARPGAKATGVHGALCVPVFLDDAVVGTLGIGMLRDRTFTDGETAELLAAGRVMARHLRDAAP